MKKYVVIFMVIALCVVFLETPSYGFSLNISPPSVRLLIPPNGTESGTITVQNKSDSPIDMRVYTQDWIYTVAGEKQFLPAGTTPLSCAKWINVYPRKFHLEGNSRLGVQYTISVPEDATGGHYAVIFLESIVGDTEAEGDLMVRFAGRMGTIIYLDTEGRTERIGSIVKFECGRPDQNKPLEVTLVLKNEGNSHIIAEGVMNIIDKNGNVFGREELGPINTLPGDTMEYRTEWLGELEEGSYDVIATLNTGSDTPLIEETAITVVSSGEIEELSVDTAAGQPVFNVIIYNTGNLNAKVDGMIDILNETEEVVESVTLRKSLVAPDSKKGIKAESGTVLPAGKYKARAMVLFGDKELMKEEIFSVK